MSVDPLTKDYPELTPYQFASNSPIAGSDLDGLEFKLEIFSEEIGNMFLKLANEGDILKMRRFTYHLLLAKQAALTEEKYDTYYWFGLPNRWCSTYKPGVTVTFGKHMIFYPRIEHPDLSYALPIGTSGGKLYPVDVYLHNPKNPSAEPGYDHYGSMDLVNGQGMDYGFGGSNIAYMIFDMRGFHQVEYEITYEDGSDISIGVKFGDGVFTGNNLLISPYSLEGDGYLFKEGAAIDIGGVSFTFSVDSWGQGSSNDWAGGDLSLILKSASVGDLALGNMPKPMIDPSSGWIKRSFKLEKPKNAPIGTNGITHTSMSWGDLMKAWEKMGQ